MKMRRQDHVRLWPDKNTRFAGVGEAYQSTTWSKALGNDIPGLLNTIQNIRKIMYITYSCIYVHMIAQANRFTH